jgi:hypothetical protein
VFDFLVQGSIRHLNIQFRNSAIALKNEIMMPPVVGRLPGENKG